MVSAKTRITYLYLLHYTRASNCIYGWLFYDCNQQQEDTHPFSLKAAILSVTTSQIKRPADHKNKNNLTVTISNRKYRTWSLFCWTRYVNHSLHGWLCCIMLSLQRAYCSLCGAWQFACTRYNSWIITMTTQRTSAIKAYHLRYATIFHPSKDGDHVTHNVSVCQGTRHRSGRTNKIPGILTTENISCRVLHSVDLLKKKKHEV